MTEIRPAFTEAEALEQAKNLADLKGCPLQNELSKMSRADQLESFKKVESAYKENGLAPAYGMGTGVWFNDYPHLKDVHVLTIGHSERLGDFMNRANIGLYVEEIKPNDQTRSATCRDVNVEKLSPQPW